MWTNRPCGQPQAAEPSDFEADRVAVLDAPDPEDESAEVEEEERPDSPDTEGALVLPEPLWESLPEPCDEPLSEPLSELLSEPWPVLRREPPRESLRESLR